MSRTLPTLFVAVFALVGIASAGAEEPPLPKGAKLRLGTERYRLSRADRWDSGVLAPDGKGLIIPQSFGGFEVIDFATGKPAKKISIPDLSSSRILRTVAISADGKRILLNQHTHFRVWDCETGKELLAIPQKDVTSAALSADGTTAVGSGASDVTVWDVGTAKQKAQMPRKLDNAGLPSLSGDGKTLALIGQLKQETVVLLYDTASGKELATVRPAKKGDRAGRAVFSPDGKTLAVNYYPGKVILYDARTGEAGKTLTFSGDSIYHFAFTPDGKGLLGVLSDSRVQWLTVADGKSQGVTKCPVPVESLYGYGIAFTADDKAVIWGNRGAAAFAWEVPSGKPLTPVEGHTGGVTWVAFSPDGKEILTSARDDRTLRWDAATGKQLGVVSVKPSQKDAALPQLALSGDARRGFTLAAAYDLQTGTELAAWPEKAKLSAFGGQLSPSADGSHVALLLPGRCVVCTAKGKVLLDVPVPGELGLYNAAVAISPSGSRVVTTVMPPGVPGKPRDTVVRAWDVATGKKVCEATVPDARGEFRAVSLSADGKTAFLTSIRGRAFAFDLESAKSGRAYGEPTVSFTDAALVSPDGKLLAVREVTNRQMGGQLYQLRVYDVATGEVRNTFDVLQSPAAFSPDGKTLASYAGYTVTLWNLGGQP